MAKAKYAPGRVQVGLVLDEKDVKTLDDISLKDGRNRAQVMAKLIENRLIGMDGYKRMAANENDIVWAARLTDYSEDDEDMEFRMASEERGEESPVIDGIECLVKAGYEHMTLGELLDIRRLAGFIYRREQMKKQQLAVYKKKRAAKAKAQDAKIDCATERKAKGG